MIYLRKLKNKIKSLSKKNIDLIIVDFDDTIFSRKEQLESDENLVKFRGEEGNNYIINVLGIDTMVEKYYIGKSFPKTITSKLRINHDLILSAGVKEFQEAKLKATGLLKFNYTIVEHAKEKPDELVRYVAEDLGFIPNKITVYEDRVDYFVEKKKFIEEFLGTNLEIMLVEMNGNNTEPNITKIW